MHPGKGAARMRLSLSRVEVQLTGLHEVMRKEAALGATGSDDLSQLSAMPPVRGPDGASQWSAGTRAELLGRRRVEGLLKEERAAPRGAAVAPTISTVETLPRYLRCEPSPAHDFLTGKGEMKESGTMNATTRGGERPKEGATPPDADMVSVAFVPADYSKAPRPSQLEEHGQEGQPLPPRVAVLRLWGMSSYFPTSSPFPVKISRAGGSSHRGYLVNVSTGEMAAATAAPRAATPSSFNSPLLVMGQGSKDAEGGSFRRYDGPAAAPTTVKREGEAEAKPVVPGVVAIIREVERGMQDNSPHARDAPTAAAAVEGGGKTGGEPVVPGVVAMSYWTAPWDMCPLNPEIVFMQGPLLSPLPVAFSGRFTAEARANELDVNHAVTGCPILGSFAAGGLAILVLVWRCTRWKRRDESLQEAGLDMIATPAHPSYEQVTTVSAPGGATSTGTSIASTSGTSGSGNSSSSSSGGGGAAITAAASTAAVSQQKCQGVLKTQPRGSDSASPSSPETPSTGLSSPLSSAAAAAATSTANLSGGRGSISSAPSRLDGGVAGAKGRGEGRASPQNASLSTRGGSVSTISSLLHGDGGEACALVRALAPRMEVGVGSNGRDEATLKCETELSSAAKVESEGKRERERVEEERERLRQREREREVERERERQRESKRKEEEHATKMKDEAKKKKNAKKRAMKQQRELEAEERKAR
eukprot:jgi/Undpi1/12171/HiC_scaffold_5.g01847.m1